MLTKNHSLEVLEQLIRKGEAISLGAQRAGTGFEKGRLLLVHPFEGLYSIDRRQFNCWRETVRLFLSQSSLFESVRKRFAVPAAHSISSEDLAGMISLLHALRENIALDVLRLPYQYDANRPLAAMWNALPELVRQLYSDGHYAEAVFKAFVHLEEVVRKRMSSKKGFGMELMRQAVNKKEGLFAKTSLNNSQRKALTDLYMGAMGFIKNPGSHHLICMKRQDATELLFFANYLVRITCHPHDAEWVTASDEEEKKFRSA